jgi:murein L,D-transpeptidase YafK
MVAALPAAAAERWILIDTDRAVAEVRNADGVVERFRGIAVGRGGTAPLHIQGDETTPFGQFRVTRINRESEYHTFIQLNYPTAVHLDRAREKGLISQARHRQLLEEGWLQGHLPQDSVLGGYIGLHGVGKADPAIHRRFNWTQGCVALTDAQIKALTDYVDVGTPVVIR